MFSILMPKNEIRTLLLTVYLKSLFGQVSFSLDLYIQSVRNIRNHDIYQFANSKHKMFKDDHKCKLQCQDVPVNRTQVTLLISKSLVVTIRLKRSEKVKEKLHNSTLPFLHQSS